MACGFVTDAISIHSIFGAFVFGPITPNGPARAALIKKLENFISSLLLQLYFAISGLQTKFGSIPKMEGDGLALLVITILFAAVGKVIDTVLLAGFFHLSFRQSASLGLLMNTKGLIKIIILNIDRDQKVLLTNPFLNFNSKLISRASSLWWGIDCFTCGMLHHLQQWVVLAVATRGVVAPAMTMVIGGRLCTSSETWSC